MESTKGRRRMVWIWLLFAILPFAVVKIYYAYVNPYLLYIGGLEGDDIHVDWNPPNQGRSKVDPGATDGFQGNAVKQPTEGRGGSPGQTGGDALKGDVLDTGERLGGLEDNIESSKLKFGKGRDEPCDAMYDFTQGEWVPESNARNHSCEGDHNCVSYGKQSDYLYWRWQPDTCDLPFFDPAAFLKVMEGKALAFAGDSIARNQMESLSCLLWKVDNQAHATQHTEGWKEYRMVFPSTNFTLQVLWAPYLLQYEQPSDGPLKVHLDVVPETLISALREFDVVIFSAGQWYYKDTMYYVQNKILGTNNGGRTEVAFLDSHAAYRTGVRTFFARISSLPGYQALSLWRTWAVDHFEGGGWDSGGNCPKTKPFTRDNSGFSGTHHEVLLHLQLEEFEKAGLHLAPNWDILNVTSVSWLRPDAHPGPHRHIFDPKVQDCLHWCIPGPVDTWNDILALKLQHHFGAHQPKV